MTEPMQPPAPTDRSATMQSIVALEASIQARHGTDRKFLSWWIYILILSWLTFGIAPIYYFIVRISRIDKYTRRKQAYYAALIDFTERYAAASGRGSNDQQPVSAGIRRVLDEASNHDLRPIGALKSILLSIVTLGIYSLIVWYQLNRAWADRQRVEALFDQGLTTAWTQLGIVRYPITFEPAPGKERSFLLYAVLTIVTFGIWGLVWDYKIHTDPDNIFPRIHQVEDAVLQMARAA